MEHRPSMSPVDIVIEIWHDIDHNGGRRVHEWFLPDGTLTFDRRTILGRREISAIYLARSDGTKRVARHVATNISIREANEHSASVSSLLILFAGNGDPPLADLVPQVVGDVADTFVKERGLWYLKERRISHVFISPDTVLGVPTS